MSGITEQVEAAGGEMVWMPLEKFIPTDLPRGRDLKSIDIYEDILNADVWINVPIAKHHMNAKLTLAMKNLMGVIADRPIIHENFGQRIADMTSAFKVADRIIMLHSGKIVADGDADYIRNHPHPVVQQFIHGQTSEDDLAILRMSGTASQAQFHPRDFEV